MSRIAAFVASLCCSLAAFSAPPPGEPLPDVEASAVTGETRSLHQLVGEERTLLVAITDRHAADAMRGWFAAADQRAPAINRVSIISVKLPRWVGDDTLVSEAKERVPREWWAKTLVDSDRAMAKRLGLLNGNKDEPWAFVIDRHGRIVAGVHGGVEAPRAAGVLEALAAR